MNVVPDFGELQKLRIVSPGIEVAIIELLCYVRMFLVQLHL